MARQTGSGSHNIAPPLNVGSEGVEAHPHRTGHRFIDLAVAGSAILISCISLFVAIEHGHTMQKLVAANSWPLLQFKSDNTDDENRLRLMLDIQNAGVGPAVVKRFSVDFGGKTYRNQFDLLEDCCGYRVTSVDPTKFQPGMPLVMDVEGQVIRSGERIPYLEMAFSEQHADAWRKLDRARFELKFDVCYCSTLGECWQSGLIGVEPHRVDQCTPEGAGTSQNH